jgi:hypothetical protein
MMRPKTKTTRQLTQRKLLLRHLFEPVCRMIHDVDVLVEFDPLHIPGPIRLAGMEIELSELIGRNVDLRTAQELSQYFRQEVVESAELQYAEG